MRLTFLFFLIILYFVNSFQVKAQMNEEEYDEIETFETDSTSRLYINETRGFHESDEEFTIEQTNEGPSEYYLNEGFATNEGEF